jgi:hypothetical protein
VPPTIGIAGLELNLTIAIMVFTLVIRCTPTCRPF